MAQSLNKLILIGRVGRDPEMRSLQDGTAVTRLSLATDRPARTGAERETDWHQVVCWEKLVEFASQYATKVEMTAIDPCAKLMTPVARLTSTIASARMARAAATIT